MNYQLTKIKNLSIQIPSLNIKSFLIIISTIMFIPAAYILVATFFIVQAKNLNLTKSSIFPLLYILLGTALSKYKLISSIFGLMMLLCMYAYYLFSNNEVDFNIKKLVYIISLIVFIIGIFQYYNPQTIIPAKWIDTNVYNISKRVYSTFFNPNIFGFYINFIIILCSENLNFKKFNIEWIVYFTGIVCLILTFSRTSWISLILSLIISAIFDKKYLKHALFISTAIFIMNYYLKTGRINITNAANDSSMLYRLEIWKVSVNIFLDNLATGIGFGTLSKHVAAYSDIVSTNIEHAHNIYLQILTETGATGAFIFVYMLYKIIKKLFLKIKGNNNTPWITAMTVLFMTLIHGVTDAVPLTPQIMMILCIYGGILSGTAGDVSYCLTKDVGQ